MPQANLTLIFYVGAALWTLWRAVQYRHLLVSREPSAEGYRIAGLSAFLLMTPPAVYLHELGHRIAVEAVGARFREIGFFLYWGYTAYTGRVTPTESWIIAAAGPAVTLLLGLVGIVIGLSRPIRPAINVLLIQFGVLQLLQILVFYPLLTVAQLGELAGSDFAVLYQLTTPLLALVALFVHLTALGGLIIGSRLAPIKARYRYVTGGAGSTTELPNSSLFRHLAEHIDLNRRGLLPGGERLPGVRAEPPPAPSLGQVTAALTELAGRPNGAAISRIEAVLASDDQGEQIGATLAWIDRAKLDTERLVNQLRYLLVRTSEPGAALYAIAILGALRQRRDADIIVYFAFHHRFTRVAAESLMNVLADADRLAAILLPRLDGLAKVELVDVLIRVAPASTLQRIIGDALSPGYEGYNALQLAQASRLAELLNRPSTSPEGAANADQVDGAGRILAALATDAIMGGSGGTLDHYQDAGWAIGGWLDLIDGLPVRLDRLDLLAQVHRYLLREPSPVIDEADRQRLLARTQEQLRSPRGRELVAQALNTARPGERLATARVATMLGISTREPILRWITEPNTPDSGELAELIALLGRQVGEDGVERFVNAVSQAVAPESFDANPPWDRVLALSAALQVLDRFPGRGGAIITAALGSPDARNRTRALVTLAHWPQASINDPLRNRLEQVAEHDPEPSIRGRAWQLLQSAR